MAHLTPYLGLGIDIGTTKVAAAIIDPETRRIVATASVAHQSDVKGLISGRSEQSVSRIMSSLDECVGRLPLDLRRSVASIGVTGQMHGVVLSHADTDEVSHLITWQDQRCLEGNFLGELRDRTGDTTAQSGYGTSTLAWFAWHEPGILEHYSFATTIHDYIVKLISGNRRPFTDASDAASFGLFDLQSRRWKEECLAQAGIPVRLLGEVKDAGEHVGTLSKTFAERWSVQEGVPVGNALGDNQASLVGSLTDPTTQIALTIGTGAQLSVVIPELPRASLGINPRYEFRPYIGKTYIAVVASLSGGRALACFGRALEEFMKEVVPGLAPSAEVIQNMMHRQGLQKVATDLCAGASLGGERYDPSLRGGFTNLSFENFTIGDMTSALCRGLVSSLRDALPKELLASRIEVVGSGNAIHRSPLMQHIVREVFGCKLTLQEGAEITACGAALAAACSKMQPNIVKSSDR